MIILKLQGGIGNQLFQYALGRNLAIKNNRELKFDISSYEEYPLRRYELGNFEVKGQIAASKEIKRFVNPLSKFSDFFKPYYKKRHIKERSFSFDPNILNTAPNSYLDGYWQSEKYFSDIENIIRKEIVFKNPLSNEGQKLSQEINSNNSVSLHVRRGDYASRENIKKIFGLCPPEYYYAAIERLPQRVGSPHLFVFSDDIPWVKENIKFNHPAIFVSEKIQKDAEELILMSQCKHHITANSSFSWWGAWLSQNPNKVVIAPKKWFNDPTKDIKDLLPSSWVTI